MTVSQKEIEQAAGLLMGAYETHQPIAPLRESYDLTIEDAYAVQEVNTKNWIKDGRILAGRKIGVTSKAVQGQLGVDQPDFGMLFSDMAYADSEEIPINNLMQPRIEGEIAFYLGKDLDNEKLTLAEVLSAVEYAVAAIEVVDSRIADWNIQITDTIADNASSGLYVLGSKPVKLSDFDHLNCGMVIEHRGQPVCSGVGSACLGNPLNACLWLAKKMQLVGRPLKAGDLILSGALGPLTPVQENETYEVKIEGLGSVRANFTS
ncbi:MAG: 2-keto-4-pentenoate hydratase [Parvibaculales bacterium]